ncbi:MAG TPA: glycosyltransferase family 4 protein [Xanthobacteraceae bacterium]|nr:glycosyltransferase family 4 protein [Xanthobacteraceae bacterium]
MTTVLMVSDPWAPTAQGVGDFAERLCQRLEEAGIDVTRFCRAYKSRRRVAELLDEIGASNADIIHIQCQSTGYARPFVSGMIARRVRTKPVVVTLHDYSSFRFYWRPWLAPLARCCATRIFTTAFDRTLFQLRFPKRSGFDTTIEVPSSLPVGTAPTRSPNKVIYFGQIAPREGIEEYLTFCEIVRTRAPNVSAALIGIVSDRHRHYADRMLRRAHAAGVEVACNLPPDEAADRMAQATFAYLPFPEGASPGRHPLAATMINGLAVVTSHTERTPDWLRAATVSAATPEEACRSIATLGTDDAARKRLIKRSAMAAKRFRWDSVTARHVELYGRLLGLSDEMPGALATG